MERFFRHANGGMVRTVNKVPVGDFVEVSASEYEAMEAQRSAGYSSTFAALRDAEVEARTQRQLNTLLRLGMTAEEASDFL